MEILAGSPLSKSSMFCSSHLRGVFQALSVDDMSYPKLAKQFPDGLILKIADDLVARNEQAAAKKLLEGLASSSSVRSEAQTRLNTLQKLVIA